MDNYLTILDPAMTGEIVSHMDYESIENMYDEHYQRLNSKEVLSVLTKNKGYKVPLESIDDYVRLLQYEIYNVVLHMTNVTEYAFLLKYKILEPEENLVKIFSGFGSPVSIYLKHFVLNETKYRLYLEYALYKEGEATIDEVHHLVRVVLDIESGLHVAYSKTTIPNDLDEIKYLLDNDLVDAGFDDYVNYLAGYYNVKWSNKDDVGYKLGFVEGGHGFIPSIAYAVRMFDNISDDVYEKIISDQNFEPETFYLLEPGDRLAEILRNNKDLIFRIAQTYVDIDSLHKLVFLLDLYPEYKRMILSSVYNAKERVDHWYAKQNVSAMKLSLK